MNFTLSQYNKTNIKVIYRIKSSGGEFSENSSAKDFFFIIIFKIQQDATNIYMTEKFITTMN